MGRAVHRAEIMRGGAATGGRAGARRSPSVRFGRVERQPPPVTDQALVALTVARAHAGRRNPTVADLLLSLAQEPDGVAGQLLRGVEGPLTALAGRSTSPRLAPLAVARDWAVADRAPRPVWTVDLLTAVVEAGGTELRELLATVGLGAADVTPGEELRRARDPGGTAGGTVARETVGLRPPGARGGALTPAAERAVARVRALAGGAVDLLVALADDPVGAAPLPAPEDIAAAAVRLRPTDPGRGWDAGLDTVVAAATTWCAGRRAEPSDLVAAAVVAGGDGPQAVLNAADAPDTAGLVER